jgi:hypothetical protein
MARPHMNDYSRPVQVVVSGIRIKDNFNPTKIKAAGTLLNAVLIPALLLVALKEKGSSVQVQKLAFS